jgi:hypothetical protein
MLIACNDALRAQRRRLVLTCVSLVLATSVVAAHSALRSGDHMGPGVAVCLAIVDTALVAVVASLVLRGWTLYVPRARLISRQALRASKLSPAWRARDGPALLQVFRR